MYSNIKMLFFFLLLFATGYAQPFIKEINAFKKIDSLRLPPKDPILLIGSSSFTNWKDVQSYFPDHVILNRGFGGSSLPHLILYADEVIFKYSPRQIIIYCGENDLTGGTYINADTVLHRFKTLFGMIRKKLPKVPVVYISMKPSPSRRKYLPLMQESNQKINDFLSHQKRARFLDVYTAMFTSQGEIRSDIFTADSLHMNSKGYQLWKPLIEPYLLRRRL